jgi:hypothetical protein
MQTSGNQKNSSIDDMNHPGTEEWMSYLYGESSGAGRKRLRAHLAACEPCRAKVNGWERTTKQLSVWQFEPALRRPSQAQPVLRWAIAAMFLILCGFVAGQTTKGNLTEELRGAVRQEVSAETAAQFAAKLREARLQLVAEVEKNVERAATDVLDNANSEAERLVAEAIKTLNELREEDRQRFVQVLQRLESQRTTELVALRKELETVAVLTDRSFEQAQRQLLQLANYTQR